MASGLYNAGIDAIFTGGINLTSADIRVIGVDEVTDAPNFSTDEDLADRAAGARIFVSANLITKTFAGGVFDAVDPTIASVSGDDVQSIDGYLHTGTESTSTLIFNSELSSAFAPNGSDVTVVFDPGTNRIFKVSTGS